jgi:hypothetical protein
MKKPTEKLPLSTCPGVLTDDRENDLEDNDLEDERSNPSGAPGIIE